MECRAFCVLFLWMTVTDAGQNELNPDIRSLHIQSDIQYRFATTLVTSRIANPDSIAREVVFNVVLPDDAFISNFTLELDGVIYPGIVKGKETARQEYEDAKRQGQNAGLVSQSPRATNTFNVEVNVAAADKVTFNLTYQELLMRKKGVYRHKIYVNPGQPVKDLKIHVKIKESRKILSLRVPPISIDLLTNKPDEGSNSLAKITQNSDISAEILYVPTIEEQTVDSMTGLAGQFIVEYDVDRALDAGDVLVVNDYFVHYIAPDIGKPIPKDILFILDVSGSMKDHKLDQLQEAMYHILDDMEEGDHFNIFTFELFVNKIYPSLLTATKRNIEMAKKEVGRLIASGGTNIHEALTRGVFELSAIAMEAGIPEQGDGAPRSPVIIFLTDGEATSGITNTNNILSDVLQRNRIDISIFTLAFGTGANWELLKTLALQNNAIARKIYEDSDADLQISGFYAEISDTMLKNVKVKYLEDTVDELTLTRTDLGNYYKGSELVVCGQLNSESMLKSSVEGESFNGDLVLKVKPGQITVIQEMPALDVVKDFAMMTEKIWAYWTIKGILDKIDSGLLDREKTEALKERALNLSLKYNFVTRLTSMVVTLPDDGQGRKKTLAGNEEVIRDFQKPFQTVPKSSGGKQHINRKRLPITPLSGSFDPSKTGSPKSDFYDFSDVRTRKRGGHMYMYDLDYAGGSENPSNSGKLVSPVLNDVIYAFLALFLSFCPYL